MKGKYHIYLETNNDVPREQINGECELIVSSNSLVIRSLNNHFITENFQLTMIGSKEDDNGLSFRGFILFKKAWYKFHLDFYPKLQ